MLVLKAIPIFLVAGSMASSCFFKDADPPEPPPPDTGSCVAMCEHIGPSGLNCEEGGPVYNSDLPGPEGEPNQSCVDACEEWQANGIPVNPDCVAKSPNCEEIEAYRLKSPDECG